MNIVEETLAMYWNQHRGLPYKEVLEYIQTDGTQYWDSGVDTGDGIGIDVTYTYAEISADNSAGLIGVYSATTPTRTDMLFVSTSTGKSDSYVCLFQYNSRYYDTNFAFNADTFYHATINWLNNGKIIWQDTNEQSAPKTSAPVVVAPLRLCGRYNAANSTWAYSKAKVKVLKISSGSSVIHDFIPVLDWNGDACLYDRVTGSMLYHKNTTGTTKPTFKRWDKTELEYLESSGTQYIDANYIPKDANAAVKMSFSLMEGFSFSNASFLFGSTRVDTNSAFSCAIASQTELRCPENASVYNNLIVPSIQYGGKHTIYYASGNISFDDVSISNQEYTANSTNTYSLFLFGRNSSQGVALTSKLRLFRCEILYNRVKIRDFIPTRDRDGVNCMYDACYNKMYYNAGTGDFTGKVKLPDAYEAVEYLASNSGAYIDTLINGGSDTLEIDAEFRHVSNPHVSYSPIFNASNESGHNFTRLILGTTANLVLFNLNNNSATSGYTNSAQNVWHTIRLLHGEAYYDGNRVTFGTTKGEPLTDTIKIFRTSATTVTVSVRALGIKDNGVLIRNFIPCICKSDGKPGLYDLCHSICPLTGTSFYVNAGTGEFIVPSQSQP